jgi:uncharacterized protein (TIGR00299 family) protein
VRLAYFDCFSGISGDMALGALLHAGAPIEAVLHDLGSLPMEGFRVEAEEAEDHGIWATRVHVKVKPQALVRTYSSIREMLQAADLPAGARLIADRVFHRLAEALAKVHGKELGVVTFHELGEVETVVEIVGCALALDRLGVERVFASPVPTGHGMARTEHGMMPIPAPEIIELLQAVPTYSRGIPVELVTPVGAAIVAAVVEGFGDMPMMRADHVGYGAGHPRLDFPNVLRVVIGEEEPPGARASDHGPSREHPAVLASAGRSFGSGGMATVGARLAAVPEPREPADMLIEATLVGIADADRLLGSLVDSGADEAWITPIIVRGGEGYRISVVVPPESAEVLARMIDALARSSPLRFSELRRGSD